MVMKFFRAEPSVLDAALIAQRAGASAITIHLREDRRHIKDCDLDEIKKNIKTNINLEMAATEEMQQIAVNLGHEVILASCPLLRLNKKLHNHFKIRNEKSILKMATRKKN